MRRYESLYEYARHGNMSVNGKDARNSYKVTQTREQRVEKGCSEEMD